VPTLKVKGTLPRHLGVTLGLNLRENMYQELRDWVGIDRAVP
jgi:hypothetical protein